MELYTCSKCGFESTSEHFRSKNVCKKCRTEYLHEYNTKYYILNKDKIIIQSKKWANDNSEKRKNSATKRRRAAGEKSMSENRECTQFLGVHVAENVLSKVFEDVIKQPFGNPGFDFICNKGKKIDVKSGCLIYGKSRDERWQFRLNKNKIADYFLCLAFDNRKDLNPMYIWLIPASDVNHQVGISVTIATFSKWDKYALDINKVSDCCDIMKGDYV